jgi:hypothetical protein
MIIFNKLTKSVVICAHKWSRLVIKKHPRLHEFLVAAGRDWFSSKHHAFEGLCIIVHGTYHLSTVPSVRLIRPKDFDMLTAFLVPSISFRQVVCSLMFIQITYAIIGIAHFQEPPFFWGGGNHREVALYGIRPNDKLLHTLCYYIATAGKNLFIIILLGKLL